MSTSVCKPANVFPAHDAADERVIPPAHAAGARYLIDGELHRWSGPLQSVMSPVCLVGPDGAKRVELGKYPLMTANESLAALESACAAYGKGRGDWPTMSVAERIRAVEAFIPRMQSVRDDVVALLMWEIGKTRPDAEKEFDRTVDYIRDTVGALKDLDRISSRSVAARSASSCAWGRTITRSTRRSRR